MTNIFLKNSFRTLGFLLIISLAACSGSDSSNGDDGNNGDAGPLANGIWNGIVTLDSGEIFDVVGILYNGKIMFIDDDAGPTETMLDGTYDLDGNDISGTALQYEPLEDDAPVGGLITFPELSFSGTVTEQVSISLSFITEDGDEGTIELTFDPDYNNPSDIVDIVGDWVFQDLTITVTQVDNETGEFFGVADSGCIVSGEISILDFDVSLYGANVTVDDCQEVNGTYNGFAGLSSDDILTIIGANSAYFIKFDFEWD